ncbi:MULTISPECIES: FKBP-type peptidyl-prolyl cis-trans isomerase [unclassified Arcicella]|uniref:FKBP-type peptidyl-prolyl cis-trans isomerase n=1 Tax=unclassified Arcicella TaxID=2644986 RepID=UPI00285DCA83|nr:MULTISPECIES: FKBP-type peptidyl-prolyl cis-trans isomerase [unclassified Arcicella]MDR6563664.1 FKBP-type peptidyl-prolyl cis-trans isomerase [Arcicella sp. BE51]MDR6814198.1 FKBP-type peptidyl-prolyl cis-trans isomerase [Arcicella sp. BE140]MDR6825563.1 FKBP-type peptidyl-prolyl cis-trans isomerase [Arcicella sp. BE139]
MNKSTFWLMLASIVGLLSSCMSSGEDTTQRYLDNENKVIQFGKDNNLTLTKDASSGAYYNLTTINATGRSPKATELVKVYYTYRKLDGTLLDSTTSVPVGYPYLTYNSLLNVPVSLLKEGEKGVFIFPETSQYTEPTILTLQLISTRTEVEQVGEFVQSKFAGLTVNTSSSGLQYVITKQATTGELVKSGQTVTVTYTGKLLYPTKKRDSNGFYIYNEQFDTGSFSFVLGQGSTVAGFEEAVAKLKVGDKGNFVFPSSLGYGTAGKIDNTTGAYSIPPYSPLNFEIEVTAVK